MMICSVGEKNQGYAPRSCAQWQRAEYYVRFRSGHGRTDRFTSHLTYQDDRDLRATKPAMRGGASGVVSDLALADEAVDVQNELIGSSMVMMGTRNLVNDPNIVAKVVDFDPVIPGPAPTRGVGGRGRGLLGRFTCRNPG
jgi:hypothetical protein